MNMFFSSSLSLSLLVIMCSLETDAADSTFRIGIILDSDTLVGRIGLCSLSLALSDYYSADNYNNMTKLVLHVRDSRGQVIDAAAAALDLLKNTQVDAIIGPQNSEQASFIAGLGDRANVPIITFSSTSTSFPYPPPSYFIRAAINDSAQVDAIASIIKHFQWNQVVLVYEDSQYGNTIIPHLSNAFQDISARVTYRCIIPLSTTDETLLQELYKMKTMQTRIFVVHMSVSLSSRFFLKAKQAGLMVEGYAWIVTSGVMDLLFSLDSHVIESMQGVLGVRPLNPKSAKLVSTALRWKKKFLNDNPDTLQAELSLYGVWAYDALWALAKASERVKFREKGNTSFLNNSDMFLTEVSQTGSKLMKAISEVAIEGLSGNFRLVDGKLDPSSFQILNVVGKEREVGIWTPQGNFSERNTNLSDKRLKSIIFPGESIAVPKGWEVPVSGKKLRIAVPMDPGWAEFVNVEKDSQTNASKVSGCYIDMFDAVMATLPYAVPYEYVPFERFDGSNAGSYDELAYQVSLQNYDAAVGDITITSKRSKHVDFSVPFAEGGVTITVPIAYDDDPNNPWVFLKPLKKELWVTAIALFFLTGVTMWILEHRFNNAYRGPPAHHAGMIFYFPFMSAVFAQRERIISNLARFVVVVWMFVVLILNSTYTASLSARLTVQRLQPSITDVKELIRKGDYVGCHKGSFIVDLLQGLGFGKLKIKIYEHPEDAHEALSKGSEKGGISALFSVTPYTKLFLSNYCPKYTTLATTYPTPGFAYVFPKGSPLVADVSRAVIQLTENGRILEIESEWLRNSACNRPDGTTASSSVSLRSFKTLFGITGGITTTCLVVFLVRYLYENRDFIRRIWSSSTTTVWSKIHAVCKHFDQRDPKSFRSKAREDGDQENASPCVNNPWSSTVVPISSVEISDVVVGDNVEEDIEQPTPPA